MEGAQQPSTVVLEASPDDVAALLRARTKDDPGREVGKFTDETRPTFEQVQELIDVARSMVRLEYGEIPDQCLEGGETTIALLAALLVEQSYWPEQVDEQRSSFNPLERLYTQARAGLAACVALHGGTIQAGTLDTFGGPGYWPFDWWQRDLDRMWRW